MGFDSPVATTLSHSKVINKATEKTQ